MTKSIFTFFSRNKFGRKLAYAAGPKDAHRRSTLTNLETNDPQSDAAQSSSRFQSRSMFSMITPELARKGEKFLDGKAWVIASVVATVTSLLAKDFTNAFLPKSVDMSTDVILLIVFWFFFIELIVASIVRRGYFLSFWFWLDFIAMFSMIPDLTLLLQLFGFDDGDINITNTQASKAGKSGRSAVALKAIRMVRFSRLLRVLRVFKFFQADDEDMDVQEDPVDAGSSKVGQVVSESVTKKVIILVLVLVLVLPWMDPSGANYADGAKTAAKLFKQLINTDSSQYDSALSVLQNVGTPVLSININSVQYLDDASTISERRTTEMWPLDLGDGDQIVFDIRDNILEEAALGMCLTLFAILIFAASTVFVTSATMGLVVQPIARLTDLLMRMAGVIGLLGGARTVENLMQDKDELFIVEALCERIMDIFGGGTAYNDDSHSKPQSSKAISMMASRKVTQITSGDRVWEIDVKEKHRTSVIERKVNRSFQDFCNSEARESSVDLVGFKELGSLQSIVDNPITLYCLRMFMTSNLTINNLLFILEVREWESGMRRKFNGIYNKYCDDRSPAQINLNATMFETIAKVQRGETVLDENVFTEGVNETWALMETNIYNQFLRSDYCKFYIHMKNNDPVTLNQLQLSVPETDDDVQKDIIRSSEKAFPEYFGAHSR